MKQAVTISIEGRQSFPGSAPEVVVTRARGTWEDRGAEGSVLSYQESAESGLDATTTLWLKPGQVVMERSGVLSSRMVFEEGEAHRCAYGTPYGTIDMTVRTHWLRACLDSGGGEVSIDYDLELEGAGTGRHALRLRVTPDL